MLLASVGLVSTVPSFFVTFPLFLTAQFEDRPRGQVTKLSSGDDLEDDFNFITEEVNEDSDAKLKKKKEPKVVNFVG